MTSGIALCAQPSDVNRQTTIAAHIPPEIAAILQPAPITVLGVKGDRVRIGIDAPGEIPVHRQEVFEKMQNEAVLMAVG